MIGIFRAPSRTEDLALFTRHVAGAMNARVPLGDILRAYVQDCEHGQLARDIEAIAGHVEAGVPLAQAMEDDSFLFPRSYRRLVRLGEESKTLGGVMQQLADSLEDGLKTYEYYRRVAIYPLLITVLLFINLCLMGFFIMPKVRAIFLELDSELPWLTSAGTFNIVFGGFSFVLLAAAFFLFATVLGLRAKGLPHGRLALSVPLFGPVLRRAETSRFAGSLSLLLANKLTLTESLALLVDSSGNSYVRKAIEDFHQRCQQGERLSELLASQPLFPASMSVLIANAEDQGELALTLKHLARFYAERASHGLTVLREVLEPLLLLVIGLMVGMVLLAMYLPLFTLPHLIPSY